MFSIRKIRFILLYTAMLMSCYCHAQTLQIDVPERHFGIGESDKLLVSHLIGIDEQDSLEQYSDITIRLGDTGYTFDEIPTSLSYTESYYVTDMASGDRYKLYFTSHPIVYVSTDQEIVDEPKVPAMLTYADDEQEISSHIGIEIRGGNSQSYPKKTYDLEFWEDSIGDETLNVQFGDLRSDDDWILDGLYNEPLRLRSFIAHRLWLRMHTPHYGDDEPQAKAGADVISVEMFLNDEYVGIYMMSEQVDRKQLKIKKYNSTMRGELYKGQDWGDVSTFQSVPDYSNSSRLYGGYEYRYPKSEEVTDWQPLHAFADFVVNSNKRDFASEIWTKFDSINYADYFIFLNLLRATDNTGKNIYLARYTTGEPYFYVPWDLDGCFGTIWDGTYQNTTDDILSNGLMDRVTSLIQDATLRNIAEAWFDYRENLLSNDTLIDLISDKHDLQLSQKIYERESIAHEGYIYDDDGLAYTVNWLQARLEFLDIYFGTSLSTDAEEVPYDGIKFYPNPVVDKLYIKRATENCGREYTIYTASGDKVQKGLVLNEYIDLNGFSSGLYILRAAGQVFKIIKL